MYHFQKFGFVGQTCVWGSFAYSSSYLGSNILLFVKKIYFPNIFSPKNDDKQMQNEIYVFLEFYHRVWLQAIQAKTSGQDLDLEVFFSTTADQLWKWTLTSAIGAKKTEEFVGAAL